MSVNGLRIGGQYNSTKQPQHWTVVLFCIFVFLPATLIFAAGGWCVLIVRWLYSCLR